MINEWLQNIPVTGKLPGYFERYSNNIVAKAALAIYDDIFSKLKNDIEIVEKYLDCEVEPPEKWMDFILNISGFVDEYFNVNYPVSFKISLIKRANWIWKNKGTIEVLEYILNSYGIQCEVENTSSFIIGLSKVGDRIDIFPYNFSVFYNPDTVDENLKNQGRELIKLYGPLVCNYEFIADRSRFSITKVFGYPVNPDANLVAGINYDFEGLISFDSEENTFDSEENTFDNERSTSQFTANTAFLIDLTETERSLNPFSRFETETIQYINVLNSLGFNLDLNKWNVVDGLIKNLSIIKDDILVLSLFIGDTLEQKRINIIGNNFSVSENGIADDNGYKFNGDGYLSITLPETLNNAQISFQVLETNLNTGGTFYDTGENGLTTLGSLGLESFNFSETIEADFINGFKYNKSNFSNIFTDITIGSNDANDDPVTTTFRWFAVLKNPSDQLNQILTNFWNLFNGSLPISVTQFHPETVSYFNTVNGLGSTVSENRLRAVNSLIEDIYFIDLWDSLEYFLPLVSSDPNASQVLIKGSSIDFNDLQNYNPIEGLTLDPETFLEFDDNFDLNQNPNYFSVIRSTAQLNGHIYGYGNNGLFTGMKSVNNNLRFHYKFNVPTNNFLINQNQTYRICQSVQNDTGIVFINKNPVSSGLIQSAQMDTQNLRLGNVIINNIAQGNVGVTVKFFAKFLDLTNTQIIQVTDMVDRFNRQINRV